MSNALIFAAGLGTRLKPLTDTMPKAMVPVCGKPLLQILIEKLMQSGVTDIVINVHHFAQQIIDFVYYSDFSSSLAGMNIQISDETDCLLETGGGLKKAAGLFKDKSPILVHNVDILSNVDLQAFVHRSESDSYVPTTLVVSDRPTQRYLLADESSRLAGWTNIATGEVKTPYVDLNVEKCQKVAYSGIQLFNPELLPLMDSWNGKFSIIDFYLSICHKKEIRLEHYQDLKLLDVGKLDSIARAETFLSDNTYLI